MIKINVIDLDKTIIPFDSFSWLFKYYLKKHKYTFVLISLVFLRITKVFDKASFAYNIYKIISKDKNFKNVCNELTALILNNLKKDIIAIIQENNDSETLNVLCSASPHDYVIKVANELGWQGYGSFLPSEKKYHMFGKHKKIFIENRFPKDLFYYNFAISDSFSDFELLNLFEKQLYLK